MHVRAADPDDPTLVRLLAAAQDELRVRYPDEPDQDLPPGAEFFVAGVARAETDGPVDLGCVAMLPGDPVTAEIKRLFVDPAGRGRGLAITLVQALEERAAQLGYTRVRLETGSRQPEAMALYARLGYLPIEPYEPYVTNPLSRCYAKDLP